MIWQFCSPYPTFFQDQGTDVCELEMSPHQLIYDMYNTIALTEIKGYAMMQFSWMLLRIYGKGKMKRRKELKNRLIDAHSMLLEHDSKHFKHWNLISQNIGQVPRYKIGIASSKRLEGGLYELYEFYYTPILLPLLKLRIRSIYE